MNLKLQAWQFLSKFLNLFDDRTKNTVFVRSRTFPCAPALTPAASDSFVPRAVDTPPLLSVLRRVILWPRDELYSNRIRRASERAKGRRRGRPWWCPFWYAFSTDSWRGRMNNLSMAIDVSIIAFRANYADDGKVLILEVDTGTAFLALRFSV